MFCRFCGQRIDDDSRFCKYCGKSVGSVSKGSPYQSTYNEFDIRDGVLVEYNGRKEVVEIPHGVKDVQSNAFSKSGGYVKKVVCPETMSQIPSELTDREITIEIKCKNPTIKHKYTERYYSRFKKLILPYEVTTLPEEFMEQLVEHSSVEDIECNPAILDEIDNYIKERITDLRFGGMNIKSPYIRNNSKIYDNIRRGTCYVCGESRTGMISGKCVSCGEMYPKRFYTYEQGIGHRRK